MWLPPIIKSQKIINPAITNVSELEYNYQSLIKNLEKRLQSVRQIFEWHLNKRER